jgi:hypothetical protein
VSTSAAMEIQNAMGSRLPRPVVSSPIGALLVENGGGVVISDHAGEFLGRHDALGHEEIHEPLNDPLQSLVLSNGVIQTI